MARPVFVEDNGLPRLQGAVPSTSILVSGSVSFGGVDVYHHGILDGVMGSHHAKASQPRDRFHQRIYLFQ